MATRGSCHGKQTYNLVAWDLVSPRGGEMARGPAGAEDFRKSRTKGNQEPRAGKKAVLMARNSDKRKDVAL